MDASEPDMPPTPTLDGSAAHMHPTALGTGARMLNAYPLVNSEAIYEGQRQAAPDQRVFILTRSGFAGTATLCRGGLVGRYLVHLDGDARANHRRPRLLPVGHAVLDDGYRRIFRAVALFHARTQNPRTAKNGAS